MKGRTKQITFHEHRLHSGWGEPREGAGRRPTSERPPVHHVARPALPGRFPSHVTLRVRKGVPSLRSRRFLRDFRQTLRESCERRGFRVVHYSVQTNHVHLIVEAAGKGALANGMKSINARLARAVNRVVRRSGPVLHGRYHLQVLRSPRQVRNAIAYVLLDARKHWRERHGSAPPVRLDEGSSGSWFDGWSHTLMLPPGHRETAVPRTWLLSTGWRRHGLIDPAEVPAGGT